MIECGPTEGTNKVQYVLIFKCSDEKLGYFEIIIACFSEKYKSINDEHASSINRFYESAFILMPKEQNHPEKTLNKFRDANWSKNCLFLE